MAKQQIELKEKEKAEFFSMHFPHRLILLRTFRHRKLHLPDGMCTMDWQRDGDLIRCTKDACIMAIRFWLEFFNFKGSCGRPGERSSENDPPSYTLNTKDRHRDDLRINAFTDGLSLDSIDEKEKTILGKVYVIGDKHVAHVTKRAADRGALDNAVVAEASEIMERLIEQHLYKSSGIEMPSHEDCLKGFAT